MKEISNFLKFFKLNEILDSILVILILYIVLDVFNIPTLIETYNVYGIAICILVIIYFFINKQIFSLLKVNVFNFFDLILVSSLISTTLYMFFSKYLVYTEFKLIRIVIVELLLIFFAIIRLIILYIPTSKKTKNNKYNVYDIKDLYENNIDNSNSDLIFIKEKDVDYDLLNRNKITEDLFNCINYCKNKEKFIISLTGKWGSGKTTILNIVKKQLNINDFIIVDNFETWKYNNEKSLLYGMFDEIIKKIGINFSTLEIKRFVNSCIAIVSAKTDVNLGLFLIDDKVINKIKLMISEYLEKNNKRVIFIIDNLERTNESNILVILKTISTLLNIDRFIYILSYDEDEMKDIFKNKLQINYDYMEKIVQLPLSIPEISQVDINNICNICIENLLLHYGTNKDDIKKYLPAIELFNKNIKDLRAFKRKINSICNSCFFGDNYLNKLDYFLIELIRQENISLYNDIRNNYQYYVSEDQISIYGFLKDDAKEFNEKATKYFDNLFNINSNKYKEILCLIFPNVEKYNASYRYNKETVKFINESSLSMSKDKEKYKKSITERRIYNAKFFELYFIKQDNDFIKIDNKIKEFIAWNNKYECSFDNLESVTKLQHKLSEILYMYIGTGQKFIIETMEMYCENIIKNKVAIVICLIESQTFMDDTSIFFGINAKERLEIVCAEIIKELSEDEFNKFKEIIKINYRNMYFIRRIIYWIKDDKDVFEKNENEKLYTELNNAYNKLIDNIFDKNINIYSKENFSRYNIYCLIDNEKVMEQMKNINENNIFNFLSDMISISIGTNGYGYSINLETFNKLTTHKIIDNILSKRNLNNLNDKEKFIKEVYEKSKEKESENKFHEKDVYINTYIDLRNLEN